MFTFLEVNWYPKENKESTRAALVHPDGKTEKYSVEQITEMIGKMINAKHSENPESIVLSHPNVMALHLLNYHVFKKDFMLYNSYSGPMNPDRRQMIFILEKRGHSTTE